MDLYPTEGCWNVQSAKRSFATAFPSPNLDHAAYALSIGGPIKDVRIWPVELEGERVLEAAVDSCGSGFLGKLVCLEFPDKNGVTFKVGDRVVTGKCIIAISETCTEEIELECNPRASLGLSRLADQHAALKHLDFDVTADEVETSLAEESVSGD